MESRRLTGGFLLASALLLAFFAPAVGPRWALGAVIKPPPFVMYYNKLFACFLPQQWTIDVAKDDGKPASVKAMTVTRPDGLAALSIELFPKKHPRFPSPEAYLNAHAKGTPVKQRALAKRWTNPAHYFERAEGEKRQAVAVLPLRNRAFYFVLSYSATAAAFEKQKADYERLLTSFRFTPTAKKPR